MKQAMQTTTNQAEAISAKLNAIRQKQKREQLPKHIHDDRNGLDYTLIGDYYFPDFALDLDSQYELSKWGSIYFNHLKQNRPATLARLLLAGELEEHLLRMDKIARARYDAIMAGYIRLWGITEELKERDQMEWVRLMNLADAEAEHNIMTELILC